MNLVAPAGEWLSCKQLARKEKVLPVLYLAKAPVPNRFKTKVAAKAIQGHQIAAELATTYKIHPTEMATWRKRMAVDKLAKIFDDKVSEREKVRDGEVARLHAKIGQLMVERDIFRKRSIAKSRTKQDDD